MTIPPQFLLAAFAGAGIWAGLKWLSKSEMQRQSKPDQGSDLSGSKYSDKKIIARLVKDPDTGVYHPEQ